MTDPMLQTLRHHVSKDKPKSVEERIAELEALVGGLIVEGRSHNQLLLELANRIEWLEAKVPKSRLSAARKLDC